MTLKHTPISLIILFIFASLTLAQKAAPSASPTPLTWQPFESQDGKFRAQFPGVPKVGKVPFVKGPVTFMRHTHEVGRDGYYLEIDYWDISSDSEDPDLSVEGGISGMIRGLESKGGRLLSKQSLTHANCPGREATLAIPAGSGKEGFAVGRVFASGERAYTMVFVSMRDDAAARSVSRTFLDSFSVIGGCSAAVKRTSPPTSKSTVNGTLDPSTGWRRIENTQLGFSVLMPGAAQLETEMAQTKPFPITHYTFSLERPEALYSLEVLSEYPPGFHDSATSMKTLLDTTAYAIKRNLEPAGFVVASLRELQLGQFPGQEFKLTLAQNGSGRAQIFVTPKRIYIALAVLMDARATAADVDRFFASLKVNP